MSLLDLQKENPNVIIQVSLNDLTEFGQTLIDKTRKDLEQMITDSNAETYPSREKVMQILDVSDVTLWRWQKQGYLKPLCIGGKRRYRMSDIKKILEGEQ
ncbi:MAG: helix-turn-helix domain-containing protein [Salinivirgaceae bacterium]|jgi:hypothetical protein|nr:helix-turn-helix domain-containing protein [Salinivirgaceae bacterium]